MKDLLKGLSNLKELDMAQLEFFILKHTDCMKVTHLTRLLPPSVLDGALKRFDQKIRAELDRIQNGEKMSDEAWEQAKQPVRTVGMGLQDIRLTAGGNYVAAHGAVCRLNSEIKEKFTPDGRMGSVERVAQQLHFIAQQLLVDRELKIIGFN